MQTYGAPLAAQEAAIAITALVREAASAGERQHLRSILHFADHRGADVRLKTGEILGHCRQPIPYPAFIWCWNTIHAYAWKNTQHINVREFAALLNYLQDLVGASRVHGHRFLHALSELFAWV